MKTLLVRSVLLFALLISAEAIGQTALGTPPFGSFGGGPFDVVNLGNLNVHFTIPIRHKAGRGMPFAYDLSYDSSIWSPVSSSGSHVWTPLTTSTGTTGTYWGWQGLSNSGTSYLSYSETYSSGSCGLQNDKTYYEYQFSERSTMIKQAPTKLATVVCTTILHFVTELDRQTASSHHFRSLLSRLPTVPVRLCTGPRASQDHQSLSPHT